MGRSGKGLLLAAGLAGAGILGYKLLTRGGVTPTPVPAPDNSEFNLTIIPGTPYISGIDNISEGATGTAVISSVGNTTRYENGTLAPYTFNLLLQIVIGGVSYNYNKQVSVGAGDTVTQIQIPFTLPVGKSGAATAIAYLQTTDGNTKLNQSNVVTFTITPAAPVNPPTAMITGGQIYYPGIAWSSFIPGQDIPYGKAISLAVGWMNIGGVPITGHMVLTVRKPGGELLTLTANNGQDAVGVAYSTYPSFVQFDAFTTDQQGTYTLTATVTDVASGVVVGMSTWFFTSSTYVNPIEVQYWWDDSVPTPGAYPSRITGSTVWNANVKVTNIGSVPINVKVQLGLGCMPSLTPDACTNYNNPKSRGGTATASIGAGQSVLVSVPIYFGYYTNLTGWFEPYLAIYVTDVMSGQVYLPDTQFIVRGLNWVVTLAMYKEV